LSDKESSDSPMEKRFIRDEEESDNVFFVVADSPKNTYLDHLDSPNPKSATKSYQSQPFQKVSEKVSEEDSDSVKSIDSERQDISVDRLTRRPEPQASLIKVKQHSLRLPVDVTSQLGKNMQLRAEKKKREIDEWRKSEKQLKYVAEVVGCTFKPDTSATERNTHKYFSERRVTPTKSDLFQR
jgi:hypothetical protein